MFEDLGDESTWLNTCAAVCVWGSPWRWASGLRRRRRSDKLWSGRRRRMRSPLFLPPTLKQKQTRRRSRRPNNRYPAGKHGQLLTVFLLLLPGRSAGSFVMHALQRSQRQVELAVRTAPESPQTLAVQVLRILQTRKSPGYFSCSCIKTLGSSWRRMLWLLVSVTFIIFWLFNIIY